MNSLVRCLEKSNTVTTLNLTNAKITNSAMDLLSSALGRNTVMVMVLGLYDCVIEDTAMMSLAKGLLLNVSLSHISFEWSNISDIGLRFLGEGLKHHRRLAWANLKCIRFSKDAIVLFKQDVSSNKILAGINICPYGESFFDSGTENLNGHSHLHVLRVERRNNLGLRTKIAACMEIEHLFFIRILDFEDIAAVLTPRRGKCMDKIKSIHF